MIQSDIFDYIKITELVKHKNGNLLVPGLLTKYRIGARHEIGGVFYFWLDSAVNKH